MNPTSHNGGQHPLERALATASVAALYKHQAKKRAAAESNAVAQASSNLLNDQQYPQTWDDYIGQDMAKEQIEAALARAKARNEPMRHVLIACNEPGVGKTALAVLIARAMNTRCFTISGTPTAQQVRSIILAMKPGDVLFIDEIHRLVVGGKSKAEWLLHILQDDCLMGPVGPEKSHLGITVVGATTDVSKLPETVIDRFSIKPLMVRYTPDEALNIAIKHAVAVFSREEMPDIQDLTAMIFAADLNPRKIKQIIEQAVDCMYHPSGYSLELVLERAGMTYDGLDRTMQRYLIVLRQAFGPMGESQIRNLLQEASLTYAERRLADKGLITFTKSGRQLTAEGHDRAGELMAEGVTV